MLSKESDHMMQESLITNKSSHCVKRAIIMAAGTGTRLHPVTLSVPKPLVKVNGIRMIDTVINALHSNGIYEIYVVTGYLKEEFESLPAQYPGLVLIDNPYYDTCNNISSLYAARDHLEDCIILDGDQIIWNPEVLNPVFERSCYAAAWTDIATNEWLLDVEDGIIRSCSRTGGIHGWQLYSVSRWTAEDGQLLKQLITKEFTSGNTDIYWDDVPIFVHPNAFELGIWPIEKSDLIEIDDISELVEIDPSYAELL